MTYESLVKRLSFLGQTLATAESCTGGLIAKQITDIPGSSRVFMGGVVTYHDDMKIKFLGVKESTLSEHGAVSQETVREMVEGIIYLTDCDFGVAVSGIAGPAGGSDEKPVGTIFIGTGYREDIVVRKYFFKGSRHSVRKQSSAAAVVQLIELIDRHAEGELLSPD